MATGKRESNRKVVWMGVSSVDETTPIPLTVDSVTGRLRVYVAGYSGVNPDPSGRAKRDANRVTVKIGDDDTEIEALSIDVTNKGVLMDG